eukprot:jgi/Ulvmu1/866/UM100_0018.1
MQPFISTIVFMLSVYHLGICMSTVVHDALPLSCGNLRRYRTPGSLPICRYGIIRRESGCCHIRLRRADGVRLTSLGLSACHQVTSELTFAETQQAHLKNVQKSSIAIMGLFGPTSSSTSSSSHPHNRTYKVFIDYEGRCHEFEFLGKEEVSAVKDRISQAEGIPPEQQILEYKEQVMEDSTKLADYRIKNRSRFQLKLAA